MPASHAQIARHLVGTLPAGVFARAAHDAVVHNDNTTLEKMLPGTVFASRKVNPSEWELTGTCEDGSVVVWRVGS